MKNKKSNARNAMTEAEKRERRALERKLSEMEEELKVSIDFWEYLSFFSLSLSLSLSFYVFLYIYVTIFLALWCFSFFSLTSLMLLYSTHWIVRVSACVYKFWAVFDTRRQSSFLLQRAAMGFVKSLSPHPVLVIKWLRLSLSIVRSNCKNSRPKMRSWRRKIGL